MDDDSLYDDPTLDRTLLPPEDRQDEFLQTNRINTLGDLVDAHSGEEYNLETTTRGLDPADLDDEDPLETTVGYAGNFSNDGMGGARVDDALMPDFDDASSMMAGEYGPEDTDLESDMINNLRGSLNDQSRIDDVDNSPESLSEDEQAVLSGGVGHVRTGTSLPTGFQIENVAAPGEEAELANEPGEPDFLREEGASGVTTAASRRGLAYAEDEDDLHVADVTEGT